MIGYSIRGKNEVEVCNTDIVSIHHFQNVTTFDTVVHFGRGSNEFQLYLDKETLKKLKEVLS